MKMLLEFTTAIRNNEENKQCGSFILCVEDNLEHF